MTSPGSTFVSRAVCEFFDPDEVKIAAVQEVLDAAGFEATATCWPVFGGIWTEPCTGKDGEEATAWLQELTDTMVRGDANEEIAHVDRMIEARKNA